MQRIHKKLWRQPVGTIETFRSNDSISACGTGLCNVAPTGDVPNPIALVSTYHYELSSGERVGSDTCGNEIDIKGVESYFFAAPNAQAVSRDLGGRKIYVNSLRNLTAWYYDGHLLSSVAPNTSRPNHS